MAPAAWPAGLLLCLLLSGCALPSSPVDSGGGTASSEPSPGTPPPARQPLDNSRSAMRVEVAADRLDIEPTGTVTLHARVENVGSGPFRYGACSSYAWGIAVFNATGVNVWDAHDPSPMCPNGPNEPVQEFAAGRVEERTLSWGGIVRPLRHAPPGPYLLRVEYRGAFASANVTVLATEPVLRLDPEYTFLVPGQNVTVHAALSNPTERDVHYLVDCGQHPWSFAVTGTSIQEGLPRTEPCAEPAVPGVLPPGGRIDAWFTWDGTEADPAGGRRPSYGVHGIVVTVRYGESAADAAARSLTDQVGVHVDLDRSGG